MSTKDRTRFKTVADYKNYASSEGCCCIPDTGVYDSDTKGEMSLQECESLNGVFFKDGICDEIDCPDAKKSGCCCSCKTTNFDQFFADPFGDTDPLNLQNGLEDDVSLCDCNKQNGRWYSGKCKDVDSLILCSPDPITIIDPRWPHACCHYEDSTQQSLICDNVCIAEDCANLPYPYSYYDDGSVCGEAGPNGENPLNCTQNRNMNADFIHNSVVKDYRSNFGHCISYNKVSRSYSCKLTTKTTCTIKDGFFVDIKYKKKIQGHVCGEYPLIVPKRRDKKKGPYTISREEASNYSIGDDFYGLGIWCGIYERNTSKIKIPIKLTGDAVEIGTSEIADRSKSGGGFNSWAIIMDYDDFTLNQPLKLQFAVPNATQKYNTSLYDGSYNTLHYLIGNNSSSIKQYHRNGVDGYYVPSLYEWGYLQRNVFDSEDFMNNLLSNEITEKVSIPASFSYATSSVYMEMIYHYSPSIRISNNEVFDLNDTKGIRNYYNLKNSQENDIHNNVRLLNAFYPTMDMSLLSNDEIIEFKKENIINPFVFLSPIDYNVKIRLVRRLIVD